MIWKTLFLGIIIIVISCGSQFENINKLSENHINIFKDSLAIEKNDKIRYNNFTCYTVNYNINLDSTLSLIYMYNNTHSVEVNLSQMTINKLEFTENPVQSSFLSIFKLNEKIAVLNDNSELFLFDHFSQNMKVTMLDTLHFYKDKNVWLTSDMGLGRRLPSYDESSVIIVISDDNPITKKNRYTFAKLNLLTNETTFYQFPRRKEMYKNYHHLRNDIKTEVVGDTLFVHYQFSEKIDLFSLKTGKYLKKIELKSKYQNKPIPHLKTSKNDFENERYHIEADYYDMLTYNPYKKCYYRLYLHSLPRMNEKGEYTVFNDKVASIAIFDSNFNWIGEEVVPRRHFSSGIIPHPKGALGYWGWYSGENYYLNLIRHD